jgi:hypothetical protein
MSRSHAAVSRGQSSGASRPVRRRCDSTFASLHIIRCVTSDFDISSVNSATGTWCRTPRFAAMQSPSPDFPIDGRAARITRLPGWKPDVSWSSSAKTGRHSRYLDAGLVELRDALEALLEEHLDVGEVARRPLLSELEDDLLGAIDEVRDLAVPLLAEPHDLLARADQPPQRSTSP